VRNLVQSFPLTCRYIEFYLDLLGNADNIGLLYTVAGMLKAVRDASEGYPSEVGFAIQDDSR
jgi:hypothetical protein